jgi:hypothetical protein
MEERQHNGDEKRKIVFFNEFSLCRTGKPKHNLESWSGTKVFLWPTLFNESPTTQQNIRFNRCKYIRIRYLHVVIQCPNEQRGEAARSSNDRQDVDITARQG